MLSSDAPIAAPADDQIDVDRLSDYLRAKIDGVGEGLELLKFPAGHSNLTYMIKFNGQELVLKCAPLGHKAKSAHDMGREYYILSKLHGNYPFAPQPVLYCEDESIIGSSFCVMERLNGVIVRRQYPDDGSIDIDQIGLQFTGLIEALAELHSIDVGAVGLGNFGRPIGYRKRQLDGWCKRLEAATTDNTLNFDEITTWLSEQSSAGNETAAVVHNDFKMDNLVWSPADITTLIGVLDWEMSTVGDPLLDLAVTLSFWAEETDPAEFRAIRSMPSARSGVMSRRDAAAHYATLTGREMLSLNFYLAFGFFRRAVIEQQKYSRYRRGETRDPRFAELHKDVGILRDMALKSISGEI